MTTGQVVERIRQKDWDIVEEQGAISGDAAPQIAALLEDKDYEVRELAVHCLNAAGGKAGREGLIKALRNESEMARSAACRFLLTNNDPADVPELTKEIESSADEFVREHVALALGKIGGKKETGVLKKQLEKEVDPNAKHAMLLALARLKDGEYRNKYAQELHDPDPAARARALKDFAYVNDRSLLPELMPLLDDSRDAVNVGPSNTKYYIRVCDVAVSALNEFLAYPFTFEVGRRLRYSPEQLQEAKMVLAKAK